MSATHLPPRGSRPAVDPIFSPIRAPFDMDSYPIKINNFCTESITNNLKDVVEKPVLITSRIFGFTGGQTLETF